MDMHIFYVFKHYINGITLQKSFCNLLFTQHCIHFNCSIEFHCMNIPQCIHSPTDGHLGCFHFFTFTNMLQRRLAHIFMGTHVRDLEGTSLVVDGRVSTSSPCQILSNVTVPIYTFSSQPSRKVSFVPHPLKHLVLRGFYFCQSDGYERETHSF